ncbi:MAG: acyl-CoA dehydrogenase [Erysipelotrichaceae bacterium]|nr:acyl-CoA dehydrogenase [Erysipelothrix sp.]MCD8574712.1 acyl-CoA dehydrogenase [Erysipelotrichaceae bacterium]
MLSEKHLRTQQLMREFTQKYVAPIAAEIDENHRFPEETVKALAAHGMMGIPYNTYGGAGADTLAYILAVEELSKACASTGVILSAHTSLGIYPIIAYGSDAIKDKYLPDMMSGKKLGAFGLTEPNAGTDAAGQKTVAVLKEGYYELTGSKIFITNAIYADVYVVFAMTAPELGMKGISAFVIEKGWEGFSFGKKEKKLGICASSTTELIFDHVKVPLENRLGKEGEGFKIAMATLDGGRIGIAAQALGIAKGAFTEAVEYTKKRKQFKQSISNFQNTQFVLADMALQIEAAQLLVYQAARAKDTQKNFSKEAAMAKLHASETAMKVTTQAVQLLGGYGYIKDYPLERMMRDAKITEIYEGTSEVQRMVIASSVLR